MTAKIYQFLADQQPATPCLIVDLDVIADNYVALNRYLPTAKVFYAVKANPAKEVIAMLADLEIGRAHV